MSISMIRLGRYSLVKESQDLNLGFHGRFMDYVLSVENFWSTDKLSVFFFIKKDFQL